MNEAGPRERPRFASFVAKGSPSLFLRHCSRERHAAAKRSDESFKKFRIHAHSKSQPATDSMAPLLLFSDSADPSATSQNHDQEEA